MHILTDKKGSVCGYLYNNVILVPGYSVRGVVLAHCVFTSKGVVKGKYFRGYIYNETGEIIAREAKGQIGDLTFSESTQIMKDAWELLARTKDHTAPWVIATDKWSGVTLEEFLLQ